MGVTRDCRVKIECPRCETQTLVTIGTDATEDNLGLHRYQCQECRRTYSSVETLFTDEQGEDCFLQLALNVRLRDREQHTRRTGKRSRRQLKPVDQVVVTSRGAGHVTLRYRTSPRVKAVFIECRRGHNLDETAYVNARTGVRHCRLCRRINQRNWLARRKLQRAA